MAFRIEVTAQVLDEEGAPVFGASTARAMALSVDPEQNLLDAAARLGEDIEAAGAEIRSQVSRHSEFLKAELAAEGREGRQGR